jgi:hypothetical protein
MVANCKLYNDKATVFFREADALQVSIILSRGRRLAGRHATITSCRRTSRAPLTSFGRGCVGLGSWGCAARTQEFFFGILVVV